jgi:geranylgeranyl transferase type-2 subunit beta
MSLPAFSFLSERTVLVNDPSPESRADPRPVEYLFESTLRLSLGMEQLPGEDRQRHATFLRSSQQADGGFTGRLGPSDLYYTSFAVRALAIMGELHDDVARRVASYLDARSAQGTTTIDMMSLVLAVALLESSTGQLVFGSRTPVWQTQTARHLQAFQREDGGYAKGPTGAAGSTYHTFLTTVCLQLLNVPLPDPAPLVRFTLSQQDTHGGFREIRVNKRASTNPTAAAVGLLGMLRALDAETRQRTVAFLAEMQNSEGGFLAHRRIPVADLLSTFTSLMTLTDLGALDAVDTTAAARFVQSLESPDGGFRAAAWDTDRDVEYTFYGLGCRALLAR